MTLLAGSYTIFGPEDVERADPIVALGHALAPLDGYRNVEVVDVAEVERLMCYLHNATHRAIVPFKDCRMCAAIRKEAR